MHARVETHSWRTPISQVPNIGSFVRLRGRRWLVEGEREVAEQLTALRLACIDDDAQSESTDVVWRAEIDATVLEDEGWQAVARDGTDDPAVFAAYLKTLRWGTATAADRDLFQAPFRAGIRLDAYAWCGRLGAHALHPTAVDT
jgi:hypothetical protein